MTRLNKSLLMLSKIENQQFSEEENVNFNELIILLTEDYADLAEFKKVKITVIENDTLHYIMNKGLAIALISNLLKNALIHNHPDGFVNFIINKNNIIISNSSNNPPLNSEMIFGRFYRHTTTNESTGLGLSIVKSIINNYSITIEYLFTGNHQFKISFYKK
jgi:two-component system OmpR family sensor kinase